MVINTVNTGIQPSNRPTFPSAHTAAAKSNKLERSRGTVGCHLTFNKLSTDDKCAEAWHPFQSSVLSYRKAKNKSILVLVRPIQTQVFIIDIWRLHKFPPNWLKLTETPASPTLQSFSHAINVSFFSSSALGTEVSHCAQWATHFFS